MALEKICLIYNTAPHYRASIFKKIDEIYDCDWYFGETKTDIKDMDLNTLANVTRYKSIGNPNKLYWQKGVLRLIFKRKYDTFFMLAETRALSCWLFWLIAFIFFPKKKIYIWTHGWYGKESKLESTVKLWLYRHVTGIFTYGDYARNELIKHGIAANKLYVIKNSLDYDNQILIRKSLSASDIYCRHFNDDYPVLLFIGRLTPVKKLDMILYAVEGLKQRGEHYNVVFVGDGTEKNSLEKLTEQLELCDNVWFYGACYDDKEIGKLIYNADLCVSPGNVGLTAMHSLVFGTPVITHNDFKWQMPEFEAIHDGETGTFFEHDNLNDLALKISSWFHMQTHNREKIREACFKEIDTYWNPEFQMSVITKHIKFD